jgi:sulfite exporter TauE/SafE
MNPDPTLAGTVLGAFLAGLAASLHCAAMCGPLACAACRKSGACGTAASSPAASYHAGRFLSYTSLGAVAGAFGYAVIAWKTSLPWLPWAGGAALLVLLAAFGTGRVRLPVRFGTVGGPALVGVMTPALPCAPLYLMFAGCAVSGSPVKGAALALAFALGTVPLLLLAQQQWGRFQAWAGIRRATWLQRGLLFAALAVVLWRSYAAGMGAPCCHLSSHP